MSIHTVTQTITGAATGYLGSRINGKVLAIKCDANTNANLTVVITGETSEIPILTAAGVTKDAVTWFYPRALANHNDDGAAATDVCVEVPVLDERIKAVVSVAATGTIALTVYYETSSPY
jgi:hypothetical protein